MAHDPYKYFRIEAGEILEQLGKGVLEIEKGGPARDVILRLLRLAHTLKGAARVVKQREIADLAHAIEDTLAPARDRGVALGKEDVERLLRHVDEVAARVGALEKAPEAKSDAPVPAPAGDVAPEAAAVAREPSRALRADVADMDALLDGIAEVNVQLAPLRGGVATLRSLRRFVDALGDQAVHERARGMIDELGGEVTALEREWVLGLEQTDRELRQVREAAERLRLLPAAIMWSTLERTARDAAVTLGKRVHFEARGGDVRLDGDVLTVVQSALVQAVRNAVAHGIEAPGERARAGKAAEGAVVIEVARRGGRVSFACRDDGRGVDVAAARKGAQRAGKIAEGGAEPTQEHLLRLLLGGGISTSSAVTEVAGRGVGLDVAREAAHRLGGEVTLRTEAGRGTTLDLVVPVSLSSMEALLVEADGQLAALPLDAVKRTLRVEPADVIHTADGEAILIDDVAVPFAPLARSLRARGRPAAASAATASVARAGSAMLIEGGGARAALGVDRLVGTESLVLRKLPDGVPAHAVVAGAWLDPAGVPHLVLDPAALVASARRARAASVAPGPGRAPILVIDDSLTTRMLEQSILESAGYEVELATSGEEGMAKARLRRYALFLVDVEMPGMDGFTFVERTRADPDLRVVPAILVTSRAASEDKERGAAAGASAYVVKSEFDQNDLLQRIRKLVG